MPLRIPFRMPFRIPFVRTEGKTGTGESVNNYPEQV
jgi:hypothetical protein